MNNENKKPIHFLVLKIIGFVGVVVLILGVALVVSGFGDFETNNFVLGGFLTVFGFMMSGVGLFLGFKPEISRMATKSTRYIQQENKEDYTAIASNTADIASDAITKTTKAIKKGLDKTMFCKHCGAEIDADSKFCNKCGKEQ